MNKEKALKPETETFKEKAMLFLHTLFFKKQVQERIVYNSFHEVIVTMMAKSGKEITRKENYKYSS